MIIIGERINATRKNIREAIERKDAKFIQQEALNQVNSGADLLDVNCGMDIKSESDNMEWLVKTVQEAVNVPLVIDSPSPEVIERGLKTYRNLNSSAGCRLMVNSITADKERADKILPLVKKYDAGVVALTMDEAGMPKTASERVVLAGKILKLSEQYGVRTENIYFDPLVRPISTEPEQVKEFLSAVKEIKISLGAKTVCGLSNVSFGLPERRLLNSTFLAMAIYAGLDAAIIDPTDSQMVLVLRASEALLAEDEYCMKYIAACRNKS